MITTLSPIANPIADLSLAPQITRLYLETLGIENPSFRVLSTAVDDLLGEIRVTIAAFYPVPDGFEKEAVFYIAADFWTWAESQIEVENLLAA